MLLDSTSTSTATASTADTQAARDKEKLDKDLNRFLTLLVTQLQHQDPLEPMDANEFTSQLVQFASVEQQIYQNSNLEKLLNLQHVNQVGSLVNYIGNTVEASGQDLVLDGASAKFTYTLDETASVNEITIQDPEGNTVFNFSGELLAGKHTYTWDGKKFDGTQLPDGPYRVVVNAKDVKGEVLDVPQSSFGRVTGAGAEEGNVSLFLGDVSISLDRVLTIKETPPPVI